MSLPEVSISSEKLYRMSFASLQSKMLIAAIELKIFDHLSEPKTAEEMAESIGGHPKNTMLFLNGLTACELLIKQNGVYRNAPVAQTFLMDGTPTSLGEGFLRQAAMSHMMIEDLPKLILEGPPSPSSRASAGSEEEWAQNAVWMANNERAGVAQQMADMVSGLPEFPSFRKMLDLGGGPGIFGIGMVEKHHVMKGVIFDRMAVVNVAKTFIQEYGLEDRISVLAGDYNRDPIGGGYDFIWASSTLNFAQNNMDAVMKKIHEALNPGGLFMNLSEGLTHEGTKPDFFVLCTMGWAMSNPMTAFAQGFIADAMLNKGFRSVRSRTVQTGWGTMDLDMARK